MHKATHEGGNLTAHSFGAAVDLERKTLVGKGVGEEVGVPGVVVTRK